MRGVQKGDVWFIPVNPGCSSLRVPFSRHLLFIYLAPACLLPRSEVMRRWSLRLQLCKAYQVDHRSRIRPPFHFLLVVIQEGPMNFLLSTRSTPKNGSRSVSLYQYRASPRKIQCISLDPPHLPTLCSFSFTLSHLSFFVIFQPPSLPSSAANEGSVTIP